MPPFKNVLAVAAGGKLGTAARYLLLIARPDAQEGFPATTFAENIAGAFLLGLLLTAILHGWQWRRDVRPLVATGALGAFTTFSAYTEGIVRLADDGSPMTAAVYALASLALGIVAAAAGITAGRALGKRAATA